MTIQNMDAYVEALWDWKVFDNCFSGGIKASDLDGIVERNHFFLVFEGKSPGVKIPNGQKRLFKALSRSGLFTVMVMWGHSEEHIRRICLYQGDFRVVEIENASTDKAKEIAAQWFAWANKNTAVPSLGVSFCL